MCKWRKLEASHIALINTTIWIKPSVSLLGSLCHTRPMVGLQGRQEKLCMHEKCVDGEKWWCRSPQWHSLDILRAGCVEGERQSQCLWPLWSPGAARLLLCWITVWHHHELEQTLHSSPAVVDSTSTRSVILHCMCVREIEWEMKSWHGIQDSLRH